MTEWEHWTERQLDVRLGRLTTATLGGESLYLVRHRDLATHRIEGDRAVPWYEPVEAEIRVQLDERNLHVTFDEHGVLYALLADGSTWRRQRDGKMEQLSRPDVRAAGHYAHRTGFVWDATHHRLVLVGGDQRNDGYALPLGAPELVPLAHGPGHGVGQTLATKHGVYRLVHDELWLLRGEQWSLVCRYEQARRDHGYLMFWDPREDALFFVSQPMTFSGAPFRVQLGPDGPSAPLRVPGSFEKPLEAHETVAQIDPVTQRLWMIDRQMARTLDLDDLDLIGGCPVEPLAHERHVVRSPPSHWYREAIALRQRDEDAPELPVAVRDGWVLSATLPISPLLPLGASGSVLVFCREDPYESDPWTLGFMNAFEVRIVDDVFPATAGGLLLDQVPYREVEPIFADRVDTKHDGSPYLARGSKIGGFPALVQGSKEEAANAFVSNVKCEDCESHLRFVAQLAWPEWDLISAVVYIYACPFGHSGAAHAQNV